jgi:hypothetical protein
MRTIPDSIETAYVDISDSASCKFNVGAAYRFPDGDLLDFHVNYSNP